MNPADLAQRLIHGPGAFQAVLAEGAVILITPGSLDEIISQRDLLMALLDALDVHTLDHYPGDE